VRSQRFGPAALATVLITFTAACASSAKDAGVQVHSATPSTLTTSSGPTTAATLDDSHQPPSVSQIAPDSASDGVVYWTRTDKQLSISRVDGQSVQTWNVAPGTGPEQSSLAPTIAAQGNLIWVAADGVLTRVDTTSNATSSIPLPAPTDNPNVEASRPSEVRGVHDIRSLAVDSSGHVAIALSAAAQVMVYDDAKGSFSTIQLPVDTDAWSVAYFADGQLAIGAAGKQGNVDTMLIAAPTRTIQQTYTVPDASRLVPLVSGTDVLAGTLGPAIVHEDGTARLLTLPTGITPNQTLGGVTPLPDGSFAVATPTRLVVVHPDNTVSTAYDYPPGPCAQPFGVGIRPAATTATTAPVPCVMTPYAVQGDLSGNLWLAAPQSAPIGANTGTDIERIPASQF
jgi:hypothetical protein